MSAVPRDRALRLLGFSVLITVLLYTVPYGRTIAWPLLLVSTLAHELAHGLMAALLGGRFHSLRILPDASGVAAWSGGFGRVATAAVAGAGLIGPALAAFVLLVLGRQPQHARVALGTAGAALSVIALLLVRNPFGLSFTLLLGTAFLVIALRLPRAAQTVAILLAVQLGLSVFSRGDYLFTRTALTAAGPMPSDVSVMADALFLPYWVWGAVCGSVSVLLLLLGIRTFVRR